MGKRSLSSFQNRILTFLLSIVMVVGLCPSPGYATQASDSSSGDATNESTGALSSSDYQLIAQAEADGDCASGQAIVVYHASGAAKGSSGELTIQSDSDPLADAGFTASATCDLSAADASEEAAAAETDGALSAQSEATGSAIASGSDVRVALIERDDLSTADLVSQLSALSFVEAAQPNYNYAISSVTDDTYADYLWGLSSSSESIADSTSGVDYADATNAAAGSKATNVVAVLDTGVDYENPDLVDLMWTDTGDLGLGVLGSHGYNGYANTYDPMPSANGEHGTHCAGIIASKSNNEEGGAGIAGDGNTQIMGLRASDDAGLSMASWACISCYEYMIRAKLAGVNLVAVNCSWGSPSSAYGSALDYAINQAGKAGILSCFAAGNDAMNTENDHHVSCLESPYLIDVAASNSLGYLTNFTNYNATDVDVAAPGAKILSTVPNAYSGAFNGLLSKEGGKTLTYFTTIAEQSYAVSLAEFDSDTQQIGKTITDANGALSVSTLNSAGATIDGYDGLRISIDMTKLPSQYNSKNVIALVSWNIPNPFKGQSVTAGDYAVSVTPRGVFDSNWAYDRAYERLLAANGTDLLAGGTHADDPSHVTDEIDNYSIHDGHLQTVDTTSDTLTAQVGVQFSIDAGDETVSGVNTCDITGYSIGKTTNATSADSALVPYMYMSGTSMATPMIAGCVAKLATIYPNYSALQLRGLICGGTVPLSEVMTDKSGNEEHISSDGRFTFEAALDSSKVNANTWSITTSGDQVTVHGYNLDGAKLYVDDTSHTTVTATGTQADSITFTADASLLDGTRHRFDVVDGATGRTYDAAYITPQTSQDSLVLVHDLPTAVNADDASLISASNGLYYADNSGSFLFCCTNPSDTSSSWTELTAAGAPWTGAASSALFRCSLRYAYANGYIYAFGVDSGTVESGATAAVLSCNVYDISQGSWSGYKTIDEIEGTSLMDVSAFANNGRVYCCPIVTSPTEIQGHKIDYPFTYLYSCVSGSEDFTNVILKTTDQTSDSLYRLVSVGSTIYDFGLVMPSTSSYSSALLSVDPATGFFTSLGATEGLSAVTNLLLLRGYGNHPMVSTGDGIVVIGDANLGLGDVQFLSPATSSATSLGSFGLSSASGLVAGTAAMFQGKIYISCVDHTASSAGTPAVYGFPASVADKLATADVTATAVATEGGLATVCDWQGAEDSSATLRVGDTATWSATADDFHSFDGWYDSDGNLVSSDAVYSAVVNMDTDLTARFTASASTRLWGASALDTMSRIVDTGSWSKGGVVVLATSDGYWDALTASGIAGLADAPVLLTSSKELSAQTQVQIEKLAPSKIIVCGGTAALPDSVVDAAASAADTSPIVVRCSGDNAIGTANDIYQKSQFATGQKFGTTAFVCTVSGYWDALSVAPYAYAKGCPIMLSDPDTGLSDYTISAMRIGGITDVYVVGGTAAVPDVVTTQLKNAGITVKDRLFGEGAIETSQKVVEFELANGMSADGMAVSTNSGYWDALAGAALCGRNDSVLVLASAENMTAMESVATANRSQISTAYVLGGTAAVPASVKTDLDKILAGSKS